MTLHSTDLGFLLTLALGLAACDPGSLSLGDDASNESDGDPTTDEPVERWARIVDDVAGFDLALGPDGSIFVLGAAGYHYPGGDGGYFDALWLGKHDGEGNLLWEHTEPAGAESVVTFSALAVDDQGDAYVSIIDYSAQAGGGNVLRKIDGDGSEEWTVVLPGRAEALGAIPGGGVVVGGGREVSANHGTAWVQVFDSDGNPGWELSFGDPDMRYSEVSSIAVTSDGAAVLGGRMGIEPLSSRARAWVAAVELSDGGLRFESLVSEGVATDRVFDLGLTADDTVLALGTGEETWVQAIDAAGGSQWTWPTEEVAGGSLAVFSDGGFALGDGQYLDVEDPNGCWGPSSPCPVAMRLARYAADRVLRWSLTTERCRSAQALEPTPDGGVLVLASCDPMPDYGPVAMGLLRYEP